MKRFPKSKVLFRKSKIFSITILCDNIFSNKIVRFQNMFSFFGFSSKKVILDAQEALWTWMIIIAVSLQLRLHRPFLFKVSLSCASYFSFKSAFIIITQEFRGFYYCTLRDKSICFAKILKILFRFEIIRWNMDTSQINIMYADD